MPDIFVADAKNAKENNDKPLAPTVEEPKGATLGSIKSMSAFLVDPPSVTFETQEQNEKIVLLLRKHFITNAAWVFASIILFFLPLFFPIIGHIFNLNTVPLRFQFIGLLLWYLFTFSLAFQNFLSWYYNVYIVTDHRVIDTDFFSLLYKRISDAPLDKIQDLSYSMGGIGSAIFNYGDVFIQTAAEVSEFDFLSVPEPDRVVKKITQLMEEHGLHLVGKKV